MGNWTTRGCANSRIANSRTGQVAYRTGQLAVSQMPPKERKLECGPMHNVMVALPNIGGALCSTPQSLADAHYFTAVQ